MACHRQTVASEYRGRGRAVIGWDWTFAYDQGVLSHPLTVVIESAGKHAIDGI
jgi:hypothetical protein